MDHNTFQPQMPRSQRHRLIARFDLDFDKKSPGETARKSSNVFIEPNVFLEPTKNPQSLTSFTWKYLEDLLYFTGR